MERPGFKEAKDKIYTKMLVSQDLEYQSDARNLGQRHKERPLTSRKLAGEDRKITSNPEVSSTGCLGSSSH